jgi:DNA-binding MarR family transcriptional regulator/GNAT superfamily N-acetyltransferase
MPASESQIGAIRAFSRFYTRQLGLLGKGLLQSRFSPTEARILYELAHRDAAAAGALARDLGLDPGYLSRILKKFERQGLISRAPSRSDGRKSALALTAKGRKAFATLNRASHDQIAAMLAPTPKERTAELVAAMATVRRLLGDRVEPSVPYILRPPEVGDIAWAAHRQAVLYAREYGWDETFEAMVGEIGAAFIRNLDAGRERCWIAERDDRVVGAVLVVRQSDDVAKLRMLYVEPEARGLGIGRRLVDECIRFARWKGYKSLTLWTNDVLISARRIYEAAGFAKVKDEPHRSFGKDLIGEYWELAL